LRGNTGQYLPVDYAPPADKRFVYASMIKTIVERF